MEDEKSTPQMTQAPSPGGVMDIQPPTKPIASSQVGAPESSPTEINSMPQEQAEENINNQPPVADEPAPASDQSPESTEWSEVDAGNQSEASEKDLQPLLAAQPASKKSKPKLAIFLAVFVSLLLIGLSVLAYLATQDGIDSTESNLNSTPPITIDEVNQASEELEKAVNQTDDQADFPENELSSQNLELNL